MDTDSDSSFVTGFYSKGQADEKRKEKILCGMHGLVVCRQNTQPNQTKPHQDAPKKSKQTGLIRLCLCVLLSAYSV